ncbi:MAG TPA: hypothetical protein VEZ72_17285 [Paenibacillus sp.]|nr:hypothetical protein [Paenibacillus sp.]
MLAAGSAQAAEKEIQVVIEGNPVAFQKAPFLMGGAFEAEIERRPLRVTAPSR